MGDVLCITTGQPLVKTRTNISKFVRVVGSDTKISRNYAQSVFVENLQQFSGDISLAAQQTHHDLFETTELYDRYSRLMEAKD